MRVVIATVILAGACCAAGADVAARGCEPEPDGRQRCTTHRADGSVREVAFERDGKPVDTRTHFYPDGAVAWRETLGPDGAVTRLEQWHVGGAFAERRERLGSSSDRGLPLVTSQRWHENGQLHWEGTFELERGSTAPRQIPCGLESFCDDWQDRFVDISPHGRVRRFRDDGSLSTDYRFEHGRRQGRQLRFHPNGVVAEDWQSREGEFVEGEREGLSVAFYPDGSPQEFGAYREGRRIGTWLAFRPNHVKGEERRYDDEGLPHGVWRSFDMGGRLVGEIVYEHGKRLRPVLKCPPDPGDCPEPWWPEEPVLPPPKLALVPAVALRCPSAESAHVGRGGLPTLLGHSDPVAGRVARWCSLADDGMVVSEGENAPDGSGWSLSWNVHTVRLLYRFERIAGVVERTQQFDYDCLCKTSEETKALDRGEETLTLWQTSGLLEARGPWRSDRRVRTGRWTFWGPDGRVSHWIDYADGAEVRRIDD